MKLLSYFTLSVVACLLLTTACQKEAADWTYSTDDAMANLAFDDLYNTMNGESNGHNDLRACANLTLSGTTFPITVTADFNGSTGCGDGRVRSGVLTAVYSDRWNTPNATVTITTTDYTVDGFKIEATNVITNVTVSGGNPKFTSVITNGKVTNTANNDVILREATKTYEMLDGSATPFNVTDDKWQLTGNATGTTTNGKEYTANITTPVIKAHSCKWVQQGVIVLAPKSGGTGYSVDYGPNVCDAQASVTYGTFNFNITMP